MKSKVVQKEDRSLLWAATRYFGTWDAALSAAKIKNPCPRRTKWSAELVLERLQARHAAGQHMSSQAVQVDNMQLYQAAKRYLGPWTKVLKLLGIAHLKNSRGQWSRESILECFRDRRQQSLPLDAVTVKRDAPHLYHAVYKEFSSWEEVLRAIGDNFTKLNKKRTWCKESFVRELQNLHERSVPLNWRVVADTDYGLAQAGIRLFATWEAALTAAGFDPTAVILRKKYSAQDVLDAIAELSAHGKPLNAAWLQRNEHAFLYERGCNCFGSWDNALVAAGLSPDAIRLRHGWSREKVIARIKQRHADGEPLSVKEVKKTERCLMDIARYYIGPWHVAVGEAGFSYKHIAKVWLSRHCVSHLRPYAK